MSGYEMLGDLLGGGLEARKETAFQNGRFRAAQTEDALTNARVNQAKAMRAEEENAARAELAAMQARGEVSYADPTSTMITQALLGGLGSDLPNAGSFNLKAQEFRNREVLGDQNASALSRTRAGDAVQGKLQGDIQGVTGKATYNLTDDTPELATLAGVDNGVAGVSGPVQNYQFRTGLKTPQEQALFDQMVRADKMVNAGGVTYSVPGVNNPAAPAAPKQVVSTAETAANAQAIAGGKTTGTTQAKLANALPGVTESLDTFTTDIDSFLGSPGFDMVYGKSGAAASIMGPVAPEEYRNSSALLDNLNSQAFLNSIQKMRGLGALSDAEGKKVEAALTSALNRNQDEDQAAQSFKLLKDRLARFRQIAELEAGFKGTGVNVGPGLQPPAALPPVNAKGWKLLRDAAGNRAYVGPNNEIEEVQ